MASESRSKGKRSNSQDRKDQKRGSDRGRSSSSGSSSSRSKRSRSRKSESRSHRQQRPRYPGGGYQRREPEKIPPNTKLFVTNIDSKFSQEELDRQLRALFEPYGSIKEIIVKTKQGSSNSYCFIEYQDVESAVKAQQELKGKDFKGKELKVEFGRGERKTEDRRTDKCYICHKEGHFAKDCRFNRFTGNSSYNDKRRDDRDRVRDRDYRDRDYDRDRDYRDKDRRDRRRKYSRSRSSSSSKSYRHRHDRDRDDYRRRDTRRSPEKRSSNYHSSSNRRY